MAQEELAVLEQGSKVIALAGSASGYQGLEAFIKLINTDPPKNSIKRTPDGKADTMVISFVETKLDEIYLGQWGTENARVLQIANEVLVYLTLWLIHPVTNVRITREGFASVQIMVDAAPDDIKADSRLKNAWALDMQNKKPNALKMAFASAKSLAIKNAAQSLGKIFGRDLNRKFEDSPEEFWANAINNSSELTEAKKALEACKEKDGFTMIWESYPNLHENEEFKKNFLYYQRKNLK